MGGGGILIGLKTGEGKEERGNMESPFNTWGAFVQLQETTLVVFKWQNVSKRAKGPRKEHALLLGKSKSSIKP